MVDRLPPAEWTKRADLVALIAALGPGNARFVGGAVRDTLMGLAVKDIDVATPLLPEMVMECCAAAGIKVVPTGLAHGTVTAVLGGGAVEITTLRHDVATDGRHATVAFATDWHADAARRDFTINALYADPLTAEIFDYFGGLDDLALRRVRFIGDPAARIAEDHLRILRYFRFQARFGAGVDAASETACAALAATLKGLSRERVGGEILALLALPDPVSGVVRMAELGVLGVVLPEALPDRLAALVNAEAQHGVAGAAIRRLAALLPADIAVAEAVAARLRLSGAQKKRLALASGRDAEPSAMAEEPFARSLAYRIGPQAAIDRLLLMGQSVAALCDWQVPQFPLKGGDVVAAGIKAGPAVARILRAVEDCWLAEGFPDQQRARTILAEIMAAETA